MALFGLAKSSYESNTVLNVSCGLNNGQKNGGWCQLFFHVPLSTGLYRNSYARRTKKTTLLLYMLQLLFFIIFQGKELPVEIFLVFDEMSFEGDKN